MVELVVKAGYEEIYNTAKTKLDAIVEDAENEIAERIAGIREEVEARVSADKEALQDIIDKCTEEIEVPEEEQSVEEAIAEEVVNENLGE